VQNRSNVADKRKRKQPFNWFRI